MTINANMLLRSVAGLTLAGATLTAQAATIAETGNTTVTFGGYVKFDAMSTAYSDGAIAAGSPVRDFYIPSVTPVEGDGESENRSLDMHARQTRINFGTKTNLDGHTVKTFIEMDFMLHGDGDERISNSYSPRIRHAFISYDKWLFGQTWTTFQNLTALPESADFIGNTDFGIFARQAQIRYTSGPWQFAAENPESVITPMGGGRVVTDDNVVPDLVGRYNFKSGDLSLTTAVLLRQLAINDGANVDSTITGFGLSISGKYSFGKDDLRFGFNTGEGMGRYIALNIANGAVQDASGDLEAIGSTALYVAYRHLWNEKWRSNFMVSNITVDNDTNLTGTGVTANATSARVNLMTSPVAKLTIGGELAYAVREEENNNDGTMNRIQFFAKLAF